MFNDTIVLSHVKVQNVNRGREIIILSKMAKNTERGNRTAQYLIAFAVSIASVTVGSVSSWPAPVIPKFHDNQTDIVISTNQIAWMVSMSSPGFMTGSLLTRFTSDKFGRRASMLFSVVPVAIGTVMAATAVQAWWLYLTRFLWGFGSGMIITVSGLYLAEIADKEIRGTLSLITRFMFNFGNLLMMCIGPFVSYRTLNYMMLALPGCYFLTLLWIPESPYFLLKEGKTNAARKVLLRIRGCKDEKVLEYQLLKLQSDVKNEMRHASTAKELFTGKKYRKAVIISAGLKFTQIITGQLIIQQYLGLIIKDSRTEMNLSTVFIVFGAVRFCVGVMSSVLADKVGRLPLLIYSYLGTGISLTIVGIYFYLLNVIDKDTLMPYSFIPFAGIIVSNIISSLGFHSIIVVVPAEIFPMNIKSVAMTSLSIYGGMLNFCVARGYQALKDVIGLSGVFWIFAIAAYGGSLFSVLYVPETKGKSLTEIQILLQGDMYETSEVLQTLKKEDKIDGEDDVIEIKELNEKATA